MKDNIKDIEGKQKTYSSLLIRVPGSDSTVREGRQYFENKMNKNFPELKKKHNVLGIPVNSK